MENTSGEKKQRKPHRYRSGTVAMRKVRKLQRDTKPLLPMETTKRMMKELIGGDVRISDKAVDVVRDAIEGYFILKVRQTLQIYVEKTPTLMADSLKVAIAQMSFLDEPLVIASDVKAESIKTARVKDITHELLNDIKTDTRVSSGALEILKTYLEAQVHKLAKATSNTSTRQTLMASDIVRVRMASNMKLL